jgi:hypothetical protein
MVFAHAAPSWADAAAATDRCGGLPGAIVAASPSAIVTKTKTRRSEAVYWGCAYRAGRARRLAEIPTLSSPGPLALGGTTFAYTQATSSEGEDYGKITVLDVRTGRVRYASRGVDVALYRSVVVSDAGRVAWIKRTAVGSGPDGPILAGAVYRWHAGSAAQQVASDPRVATRSLALSQDGSTIFWSMTGQAASAAL